MIESVVALLMFVNAEIKEARFKLMVWLQCFEASDTQRDSILKT